MRTKVLNKDLSKVYKGLNKAAEAVISTMGPEGQVVVISDSNNTLKFTKDGVSVARAIKLDCPEERIGANILISSAQKTVKEVGDGTTTTSLLLKGFIDEHKDYFPDSIPEYLEELETNISIIKRNILALSKKVKTLNEIENISTTASNSKELGKLLKQVYKEVGFNSLVKLERSQFSDKTYYEKIKGLEFKSGYAHPAFITNKMDETAVYENPYIHIDSNPVNILTAEYERMLDVAYSNAIPVVIIAPRFSDAFIRNCVMNKTQRSLPVVLIKSPGYAHGINKNYDDIKAFLDDDSKVERIVVNSHSFILYNENTPNLKERTKQLERLKETAQEEYDQRDYGERIHRLNQSSAIIYAGGRTLQERDEEFDRIEDALGSISAAIRFGYVKGSGETFIKCKLNGNTVAKEKLNNILELPKRQIFKNAKIKYTDKEFDVRSKKEVDFYKEGIIDPAEVLVESISNAFASYKLLLNTSYIIYNEINNNEIFKAS